VADDYKVVTWSVNDDMSIAKLNAMVNNMNVLRRTQPRATYRRTNGTTVSAGIKFLGGRVIIPARNSIQRTVSVNFGNFFSTGCSPIVTFGVISSYERAVFVKGRGQGGVAPKYNRLLIDVVLDRDIDNGKKNKIDRAFYVDYHAIGY